MSLSPDFFKKLALKLPAHWIPRNITAGYDVIVSEIDKTRKRRDPRAGIIGLNYQDAALAEWYLPKHEYVPALSILVFPKEGAIKKGVCSSFSLFVK